MCGKGPLKEGSGERRCPRAPSSYGYASGQTVVFNLGIRELVLGQAKFLRPRTNIDGYYCTMLRQGGHAVKGTVDIITHNTHAMVKNPCKTKWQI